MKPPAPGCVDSIISDKSSQFGARGFVIWRRLSMSRIHTRTRLVSFRLSEGEYEHLRLVTVSQGARSVSDFVRTGVSWIIENCDRPVWDFLTASGQNPLRVTTDVPSAANTNVAVSRSTSDAYADVESTDPRSDTLTMLKTLSGRIETLCNLVQTLAAAESGHRPIPKVRD